MISKKRRHYLNTIDFWSGEFGDKYHARNNRDLIKNNIALFEKIFFNNLTVYPYSILEFGAGTGLNIWALKKIFPIALYSAVEINKNACKELDTIPQINVINSSARTQEKHDLVLTKGFLIHIPPEEIEDIYNAIYESADKYILMCEYFNPTLIEVKYRGNNGRMWKRDFAGDMLERNRDLQLLDYGFAYKRDEFPQDNLNWFLLEKR